MEKLIESCKINNKSASIELVFSNNAKASGLSYAKNRGIETSVIDHRLFEKREDFDGELDKKLRENKIDLICNAGFMRILSEDFVNDWFNKQLNIHPSLLPDFKGLDVHKRVIESKTNISDNVFIGSNSSLVAPVKVGKNSVVGAGSVITKNVKKKTLALSRPPQLEIKNYKRKKK